MPGIRAKIKYLLASRNFFNIDYADHIGMTRQGFNQKLAREAFAIRDLIDIGDFTNYKLAYVDQFNRVVVTFDKEDLNENIPRKGHKIKNAHTTTNQRKRKQTPLIDEEAKQVIPREESVKGYNRKKKIKAEAEAEAKKKKTAKKRG